MNNKPLEKIENEKLPKLADDEIVEIMEELLQEHPEINISMIYDRLRSFFGEVKPISKKRLKKLIGKINFTEVTGIIVGKNGTLTSNCTTLNNSLKKMPVQNRLDYMNKYDKIFFRFNSALINLSTPLRVFEQVNNSFTDEERLAAEVLKKPIGDYSYHIEKMKALRMVN